MRESLPWQQQELPLSYCQPLLISCGTLTVTRKHSFLYLINNVCVCVFRLPQPRARDMLDAGVVVALGSDFNPNAYCCSMVSALVHDGHRCSVPWREHVDLPQPIVMHLACVNMRMTMSEALAAATINAAYALGRSDTHGSLEVGKHGDLVILSNSR